MNQYLFKIRSLLGRVSPRQRAEYFKKKGILNMGEECEVYGQISFGSEPYLIKMGNKVRITRGVRFVTHDGGMWVFRNLGISPEGDLMGTIVIGDNVFIGINSIVMPNVKIGSNVIIGAGSIITKDIPDNSIAVGVPARVVSSLEAYYNKNESSIEQTKHMNPAEKKRFYMNKFKGEY